MPENSKYIRLNLGSILVERELWERAKRINGYTREDIRQVIVQNGESALRDAVDTSDYCEHGIAASSGCEACHKQD